MSATNEVKEFYPNDVVYRFDKRKRINFGVVIHSYETTADAGFRGLQKGHVQVWWLNNSKESVSVWKQNKIHLISRNFIPGDIVRRLENGKESQRGYCKDAKQYATVRILGTNKIIEHVSGDRLHTVTPFYPNVAVCLENKYGRLQSVDFKITMQSKCGSTVEIFSSINHDIEDYWLSKRNGHYFESYYPGMEVICMPKHLEQPNWLYCSNIMKKTMRCRQRFTVQKVEPSDIEVAWDDSVSNFTLVGIMAEDLNKLKILEPIENIHLELPERRLLKLTSSDVFSTKKAWISKQSVLYQPESQKVSHIVNKINKKNRGHKLHRPSLVSTRVSKTNSDDGWCTDEPGDGEDCNAESSSSSNQLQAHFPPKLKELIAGNTVAVEILYIDSKACVVWQDGTEENDIPTTQLYYSVSLDDHEFFPGEWVVNENNPEQQYGVIQQVSHLERTATVKWFTVNINEEANPSFLSTDEMSVYDLKKQPKYAFRPGSTIKALPIKRNALGSVLDSCPEGFVTVKWINGTIEKCWPHRLAVLPDSIDYEYSVSDNDESDQVSWETESIESIPGGEFTDGTTLQNMAARLDFVRERVAYLKEVLLQKSTFESFSLVKELLTIYDNSSYLDKLLDTTFFSLKSKHFQLLLSQIKEKAKSLGLEIRGRIFNTGESTWPKSKNPEKENINRVMKLEYKLTAQIDTSTDGDSTPDSETTPVFYENICVELLSMMKARMDLAYAEMLARIGGPEALTVMTKATDSTPIALTPLQSVPTTPEHQPLNPLQLNTPDLTFESESYTILEDAHSSHHFYNSKCDPTDRQRFFKAIQKEFQLLKDSLPPGVWVRSFSNRMDLLSVMIRGPDKTPYEDGLFLFDIQLSPDYPRSPPVCHFISFSSERLNPNLYVEGKVCISLLGTWMGRGTEVWGPDSTLLQLIVSIQGLILVSEPYYNEAGYEKQLESQQGYENSRTYNELVILKLVQSMTKILIAPPEIFKKEICNHFGLTGGKMCNRLYKWCDESDTLKPEFPLLPVSKGFKLSLVASLKSFQATLKNVYTENANSSVLP